MNYYDLDCCPFCKNESMSVMPNTCRICEECDCQYSILKFANKTFSCGFRILRLIETYYKMQ
jgi:hypothetical protein